MRFHLFVGFFSLILALCGCAQWKSSTELEDRPPTEASPSSRGLDSQIPDDASILEISFLSFQDVQRLAGDQPPLWDSMDETVIAGPQRGLLLANGLRIGRLMAVDSQMWQGEIAEEPSQRLLREASVLSDFHSHRRRLTCRSGQVYTLAVRRPSEGEQSLVVRNAEGGLEGRSLQNPQYMFRLRCSADGSGEQWIELVPEIHHGSMRQNFVANQSLAIRVDYSREQWTIDDLRSAVPLSVGQAVLVVPAEEERGLGQQMLIGRRADQSEERIALVIQLTRGPLQPIAATK